MEQNKIIIKGAKENNLKNIDLEIPRNTLTIMTGLSGSGKTSLAFDTIYAEGQRRYVESLSPYARQFLGGVDKPNVELIEGLSPAIAIDQKTTSNNPRSTVGTVTEIYDFLRLLYARVGIPYCPDHHEPITAQTITQMIDKVMELPERTRLEVMSPVIRAKKGTHKDFFAKLLKDGYTRVRVDGENRLLEEEIELEKNKKHDIDVVVDRMLRTNDNRGRLHGSLENALNLSNGLALVKAGDEELLFSSNYACKQCGFSVPHLEPRLFSFNAPLGACENCNGIGTTMEVDTSILIPDPELSINEGGIKYYKNIVGTTNLEWQTFKVLLDAYDISLDKPLKKFTAKEMDIILYGSKEPLQYTLRSSSGNTSSKFAFVEGVKTLIERRCAETTSSMSREWYQSFMMESECPVCRGKRLNRAALSVQVGDKNIHGFTQMSVKEALNWVKSLDLNTSEKAIADLILQEIISRLEFLKDVGLDYLTLDRLAGTLSGGEAQRIRLATQIGSKLTGVLYVLDEPSIGLHQRDNDKLIATLKRMRDLGNTLIVVEHDEDTMRASDYIVDIGPGAGIHGGEVIATGTPDEVMKINESITGQYLCGAMKIDVPSERRKGNGKCLEVVGATQNNLKNLNVKFPLGKFIVVTGVSGSGKSTLVNEILCKGILQALGRKKVKPGMHKKIKGLDSIDKV
ncbi:MAG: excinuclease ABC subunit UvrA, partial [Erysipelotrichaceae bacterium]|nr:excinuclease ABC subunit UvrA [Erysipelotrichaceae bacterium]